MSDIVLDGITKRYGSTTVLDRLSLTIRQGEFLTLLGASGCGKSTLLKLLAGLELPDSGTLRRGETDWLTQSPGERDCAMVFQSYALYPHMTVGDNICTPLYMRSMNIAQRLPGARWFSATARRSTRASRDQGHKVAEILGIDHLWSRKPAQLSGGQRQRVALARAMVRRPSVFLFDEPLSNLDANLRQSLRSEIRQLHDELGVTFVYVTHDQHEAMSMSDRVAVMKGGHILQLGSPQEIYHSPCHADVASFVGAPRINFIDGGLSGAARLAFRPQAARLTATSDSRTLTGRVVSAEFMGAECLVTLQINERERVMVVLDLDRPPRPGDTLPVHIPLCAWHPFDAAGARLPTPVHVVPMAHAA